MRWVLGYMPLGADAMKGWRPMTTVLVVDDDRSIREALRILLEAEGYAVLEADDGVLALALLRATPEHLVVLLNMHMRHLNGLDVLREVAADPALPERHAYVLMTAAGDGALDQPDEQALLHQLGVPILRKPFEIQDLVDAVATAAACHLDGVAASGTAE